MCQGWLQGFNSVDDKRMVVFAKAGRLGKATTFSITLMDISSRWEMRILFWTCTFWDDSNTLKWNIKIVEVAYECGISGRSKIEGERLRNCQHGGGGGSRETAKILSQNMYKRWLRKAGQTERIQKHLAKKGRKGTKRIRVLQHSRSQMRKTFKQNSIECYELLIMACIISVEILTNCMIDLLLLDLFSLMKKLT